VCLSLCFFFFKESWKGCAGGSGALASGYEEETGEREHAASKHENTGPSSHSRAAAPREKKRQTSFLCKKREEGKLLLFMKEIVGVLFLKEIVDVKSVVSMMGERSFFFLIVFFFFFFFVAEDSFVEGEEGDEYDEEDEEDYSAASTTSGPKKSQTKNSFWGWMDQVGTTNV
jgi:hypothetical protein